MSKYGKLLVLVLAVALVASIAGCTTPTTTGTGEATSTAAPAADLKLVTPGQLTVGSDTSFPPFESMEGNVAVGFDVDLMNAIGKEMGIPKVVFLTEGFDTLIPTLKAGGKFDVIASGMTIKADRQKEIDFSDPYYDSNQSVAMKAGSTLNDVAELSGKKIGVQSGTTGEEYAGQNIPNAKLVPFKTATEAFAALQAGNVDAVINDLPVTVEIVKDKARGLVIVKEIPTGEQYGFGVSKDNPDLLKAINEALAKVKASGEYQTLYDKYFAVQ
jgi:polar amino acid transport system substrate-binding protein